MFEGGLDTLAAMTDSERQRWTEILAHPYRKDLPASYALWDWLHRITGREAPRSVMSMILDTKLLTKVAEQGTAPWVERIAAMCPASQRQELREQLAKLDQSQAMTALTLLEILDGMENDRPHV